MYQFSGIKISNHTLDSLTNNIIEKSNIVPASHIHLCAASTFVASKNHKELTKILNDGQTICDSKPLSIWTKLMGEASPQIRGMDLFQKVLGVSDGKIIHFLLGSSPDTLRKMEVRIRNEFPNVVLGGTFSPSYSNPSRKEITLWSKKIKKSGSNLVWIGLGSPKQDHVAYSLSKKLLGNVICIGAAFDFFAGTVPEAPKIIRRVGLEWLFRLISNPKRLIKRYTIGNLQFIIMLAKDFIQKLLNK